MVFPLLWLFAALLGAGRASAAEATLPPIHPRKNVEPFAPTQARHVRFVSVAHAPNSPIIDELEIYGPAEPGRNLAARSAGARPSASAETSVFRLHELSTINDGRYGNGYAYLFGEAQGSWVAIELPKPAVIDRVVWGRDREGRFVDRVPQRYRIEVSMNGSHWREVASSERHEQPVVRSQFSNPWLRRIGDPAGRTISEAPLLPAQRKSGFVIDAWRSEHGLPSNTVTTIAQDARGFLWLGTSAGLAVFDGFEFAEWREPEGLSGAEITALLVARDGSIWVGTAKAGLWRIIGGEVNQQVGPQPATRLGRIAAIGETTDGAIWVAGPEGLHRWHQGRWQTKVADPVHALAVDPANRVWYLNARFGLRAYDRDKIFVPEATQERSLYSSLLSVATDPEGGVWFGGANSYVGRRWRDDVQAIGLTEPGLQHSIWALLPLATNDLWVGTASGGLTHFEGGRFTTLTTEDGLTSNAIRALAKDHEGNLWVGTEAGGLMRLKPRRADTIGVPEGLSHSVVLSLSEDRNGEVWIGTKGGGVNRWHDGRVRPFSPAFQLENELVQAVATAPDGTAYLGGRHAGLISWSSGEVRSYDFAGVAGEPDVRAIFIDRAGTVWIGAAAGVFRLGPGGPKRLEDSPPDVTTIVSDRDELWVGTASDGLHRWNGHSWRAWRSTDGLGSNSVRTLALGAGGTLWIGTNHGLARLRQGQLRRVSTAEGLPDGVISQILFDDSGHLWAGSNGGIFRLDLDDLDAVFAGRATRVAAVRLTRGDGLETLECTGGFHPAGLRRDDGDLWFSTVAGIVRVDPARFSVNRHPARVWLNRVVLDGVPQSGASAVTVPARTTNVAVEFTGISLTAPERVRFRWRVDGNPEWTEPSPSRQITLTQLPPGHHRLEIAASNSDGLWMGSPARLELNVLAPWWRHPALWPMGLLAASGLVALGVRTLMRRRMRQREAEMERRVALEQERTRIARDLHDELGASLARVALLTDSAQETADTGTLAEIGVAAREATAAIDSLVWAVNPQHDTLDSLVSYLVRFSEEFLRAAGLAFRIEAPEVLPPLAIAAEVRHHLFLCVKEAVHNAAAHAGGRMVTLSVRLIEGALEVGVRDDGRGMDANARRDPHAHGLANLHRRMAEVGGTCTFHTPAAGGTEVRFTLPVAALNASARRRSQ